MIDQDIKLFVLRWLVRKNDAVVSEAELKGAIRLTFHRVSFSDGDLNNYIAQCEEAGWLSGTQDELLGKMWALTPKGKIKAQQL